MADNHEQNDLPSNHFQQPPPSPSEVLPPALPSEALRPSSADVQPKQSAQALTHESSSIKSNQASASASVTISVTSGLNIPPVIPTYEMPKNVNHLVLSIHPLVNQFNEFAQITERKTGNLKIDLFGVEAWFRQAKIFQKSGGGVSLQDVRSVFYRMSKESLSFTEFEDFIEALSDFRKVHPDKIVYRLRLCGSPGLEARFVHVNLAEGTVDRLIDTFGDSAQDIIETFYDTSTEPYVEPICKGGVRGRFREEQARFEKDVERITKARKMEMENGMDPYKSNFIYFAKNLDYYSDGRKMSVINLIRWMKQAGVIDGHVINSMDVTFLFKKLYSLEQRISFCDMGHFLGELSNWKIGSEDPSMMIQKLRNSGPPARSSVTVVTMKVPEEVCQIFKQSILQHDDEFFEEREKYIPKSADTPSGHTPKSRDRFFQNELDTKTPKVVIKKKTKPDSKDLTMGPKADQNRSKSKQSLTPKGLTRNSVGGEQLPKTISEMASASATGTNENSRAKKLIYYTKRWPDAYPYGGHEAAYRQVRLDPEIQRYTTNLPERDTSSSEEDLKVELQNKKKAFNEFRRKYSVNNIKSRASLPRSLRLSAEPYTDISFEEQFNMYSNYEEEEEVAGISRVNTARWMVQAHIMAHALLEIEDIQKIERNYYTEVKYMTIDKFKHFIDEIAGKRKIASSELLERLRRCGPPNDSFIPYKSFSETIHLSQEQRKSNQRQSGQASFDSAHSGNERRITEDDIQNEELFTGDPEIKELFTEYARFGQSFGVQDKVNQPLQISLRNIDKWFKQSQLVQSHKLSAAETDVFFKQLYHNAGHINLVQFYKLVNVMAAAKKADFQHYLDALKEAGHPGVSGIPKTPVSEVYENIRQSSDLSRRNTGSIEESQRLSVNSTTDEKHEVRNSTPGNHNPHSSHKNSSNVHGQSHQKLSHVNHGTDQQLRNSVNDGHGHKGEVSENSRRSI